jgi:asparagine synthase (glutamine-hydrolysing)
MYHSLEVRVPLLSKDLVDFVTGLPIEYRIAGHQGKRILRDAYRGIIPDAILDRKKMGFEVPVGEFLRNELRDLFHDVVRPEPLTDLGIDPWTVARIYQTHAARREDYADLLWAILVLCWWKRR